MIVCISPNYFYMDETINSLKYAQKAKKIKENKNPVYRESQTLLNTQGSLNDKIHIENLEKEIRYLKGILIAKGRNESKSSNLIEQSPATPAGSKPQLHHESPALDSAPPLSTQRYLTNGDHGGLEEFDELLEALVENIEDLNALRNNLMEIDALISQTDEKILTLQDNISESNEYQKTQQLYKDLRVVADKLEEHLDLKEQALSEIEKLQQTIKCTKLALRRINSSRGSQMRIDTGADHKQNTGITSENAQKASARQTSQQNYLANAITNDPMISSSRDTGSLLEEVKKRDQQIQILTQALKNLQPQGEPKIVKNPAKPANEVSTADGAWKKKNGGTNATQGKPDPIQDKENCRPNIPNQPSEQLLDTALFVPKQSSLESLISSLKGQLNPNSQTTTASSSARGIPLQHNQSSKHIDNQTHPEVPKLSISAAQSRASLLPCKTPLISLSRPSTGSFFLTAQEDTGRETHAKPSQQTATFGPIGLVFGSTHVSRAEKTPDGSISPREDVSDADVDVDGISQEEEDIMDHRLFIHEPHASDGARTTRADHVTLGPKMLQLGFCVSLQEGTVAPEANHGTSTNPMSLVGANSDRDELYHEEELEDKRNGTLEVQPLNRRLCI